MYPNLFCLLQGNNLLKQSHISLLYHYSVKKFFLSKNYIKNLRFFYAFAKKWFNMAQTQNGAIDL